MNTANPMFSGSASFVWLDRKDKTFMERATVSSVINNRKSNNLVVDYLLEGFVANPVFVIESGTCKCYRRRPDARNAKCIAINPQSYLRCHQCLDRQAYMGLTGERAIHIVDLETRSAVSFRALDLLTALVVDPRKSSQMGPSLGSHPPTEQDPPPLGVLLCHESPP